MNKTIKTFLTYVICIGTMGTIFWLLLRYEPKEPEVEYKYITDTIYVKEVITIPSKPGIPVKPITVIEYISDTSSLDSLKITIREKDIYISNLKDTIALSKLYLSQFPKNPKLLFLNLSKDSLSMGLLNTSGNTEKLIWPMYYDKYSYTWTQPNGLSLFNIKPIKEKPKLYMNYFVGSGINLLNNNPYLSGKCQLELSRIQLYGGIEVGLLDTKSSQIRIGIDYQINGKTRIR